MVAACPTDEVPKLTPENRRFVESFMGRMMPGLSDGSGGFHITAIDSVIDRFHIPEGQAQVMYDRALVIIRAIQEVRVIKKEGQGNKEAVATFKGEY